MLTVLAERGPHARRPRAFAPEAREPEAGAQGNFCRARGGKPRTKAPATLGAPGPRGAAGVGAGPYLSWSGRAGLCSAARAGEERRAGSAWPGPRRSLHPGPAEVDDRFQPRVGPPFMRASPRPGVRVGQARCRATTAGAAEVRAHLRGRPGTVRRGAASSAARESLIKPPGGRGRGRGVLLAPPRRWAPGRSRFRARGGGTGPGAGAGVGGPEPSLGSSGVTRASPGAFPAGTECGGHVVWSVTFNSL